MIAVVADPKVHFDESGDPMGRPQFCAVALGHGSLQEQLQEPRTLLVAQLARPAGRLAYLEPFPASSPPRITPSHHRTRVTTDPLGYLVQRTAIIEQMHRSMTASLKLLC